MKYHGLVKTRHFLSSLVGSSLWLWGAATLAQSAIELQAQQKLLLIDGQAYTLDSSALLAHDATCQDQAGGWQCGEAAWQALEKRLEDGIVNCTSVLSLAGSGSTGLPAECTVNGDSLNAWLVRHGWALTGDQPFAQFKSEENTARAEQIGMWRDGFTPPVQWRARITSDCNVCTARHQSITRTRELRKKNSAKESAN